MKELEFTKKVLNILKRAGIDTLKKDNKYDKRFYVRTEDFLIEDTALTGGSYRYMYEGPFDELSDAIKESNRLRIQHHLGEYDYELRISNLRKYYPKYPEI